MTETYKHNPSVPIPSTRTGGRLARVGTNTRNHSDAVFRFGGDLDFRDDLERYRYDVAEAEKRRRQEDREKRAQRIQFKRDWINNLDTARWSHMAQEVQKEEALRATKHINSRIGRNKVGYDPITGNYLSTAEGAELAAKDENAMHKVSTRATKLYLRNNTFDPLRCEDIVPNATPLPGNEDFPARGGIDVIRRIVPMEPAAFREGAQSALSEIAASRATVFRGARRSM
ncbi:hypothetical protein HDU85_007036 [Gaertneriomyces sp. JEL0708]|nr:hypothetical protein HDU85_007036 [Gaertneriomyces sp. JEL0708]